MNKCYSKICKEYKTELRKKVSFCKRRNKSFKKRIFKIKGIIVQSGGTNELEQLAGIKIIDQEVERNNKLMSEYIEQLRSIYSEVTNKTANVSSEELAAFTEKLKLKEEMVLGQFDKIKTEVNAVKIQNTNIIEKNQLKIKQLNNEIDRLKRQSEEQTTSSLTQSGEKETKIVQLQKNIDELNIQNRELQQKSSQFDESNRAKIEELNNTIKGLQDTNLGKDILNDSVKEKYDLLVEENNNLKKKISSMEELKTQLTECQKKNQQCKQADMTLKKSLPQVFETYDDELVKYVKDREQTGGKRKRIICRLPRYINKLEKYYNSYSKAKNNYISKCIKIYAKKKGITLTKIKNELRYLFKNRKKYIKKTRVFRGGSYDNKLVTSLLSKQQIPDQHFEDIYKQLKGVIKGTSSSSDEGRNIMNDVYLAVLGKTEEQLTPSEKKFIDKNARTIVDLGKQIIGLMSDCTPIGKDKSLKASITIIQEQADVLQKLVNLVKKTTEQKIKTNSVKFLPVDAPSDLSLQGDYRAMIENVNEYYSDKIKIQLNPLNKAYKVIEKNMGTTWDGEDLASKENKKILCQSISILEKLLIKVSKELDLKYIVNKFEDISGAVRVYVRVNDFAVRKEEKELNCEECLGRSYGVEINKEKQETRYIVSKNPCGQDPFYKQSEKINSKKSKSNKYTIITPKLLEENGMSDFFKYGPFFGTYQNTTNLEIFNGNDDKDNSPALKDALLQATKGYSIILFGYGYSGSGKSYTLLDGDKKKDFGMLSNFMAEAKQLGARIDIDKISELYGRFDITNMEMSANEYEITQEELKAADGDINFEQLNSKEKEIRNNQITKFLATILKVRSKPRDNLPATIKGTPNNPASSRSHLFIRLKVTFGGNTGYLTIVDMAGIEDPTEIAINIYPFIDLRNLINPFKDELSEDLTTTWANLQPGEFKSKEIAQQKLAVHFGKVCTDLQKVEREICSDKSSKFTPINGEKRNHIRKNWKWLKDCNDRFVNDFKGYPMNKFSIDAYTFIKGSKRGSARQKVFSSNEKILSEMKKIQKQILTKGQAFKFLKNLKEVFHYTNLKNKRPPRDDVTEISTPKGKVLMELIKKQLETLEERSTQYKYIEDISNLTIHEARKDGYNVERMCKEKFTFLMNYCFSCMILNGIIKDYEDLEKGNINYVDGKKIYLTGFLGKSPDRPEGTKISYKEYIELVEEGIFINETVNHLSFYFKKKNNPDKKSDENEELRELLTRFDASSTLPRSTKKPRFKTQDPKSGWSEKIFFSLKTYLPTKFLFNPENEVNKNVLIKRVLNELDSLSAAGKPSKFIMMCLLRPEIDATYCTGARNTLTFAKSVCSTCT